MTDQLNLTQQNAALNWTRFWLYSKVFLSFLIVLTLVSSLAKAPSAFYVSNIALCLLFGVVLLLFKFKRKQIPFVKIEDNQVQYFCPVKKEVILIPANEITKVSTHFCELQIHTYNRTHCINMNKIKQEQQRWEIKEMIKKLAVENEKRACGF